MGRPPYKRDLTLLIQDLHKSGQDLPVLFALGREAEGPLKDHMLERIKGVMLDVFAQRLSYHHAWSHSSQAWPGLPVFHHYTYGPPPWQPANLAKVRSLIWRIVNSHPSYGLLTGDIANLITPNHSSGPHKELEWRNFSHKAFSDDLEISYAASSHAHDPYSFFLNLLNLNLLHLDERADHRSPEAPHLQHQGLSACLRGKDAPSSDPLSQSSEDPLSDNLGLNFDPQGLLRGEKAHLENGNPYGFFFTSSHPFTMASDLNAPFHNATSEADPILALTPYFQTLEIGASAQDAGGTINLSPSLAKTPALRPENRPPTSYKSFPSEESSEACSSHTLPYASQILPLSAPNSPLKTHSFPCEPDAEALSSKATGAPDRRYNPAVHRGNPSISSFLYGEHGSSADRAEGFYSGASNFGGFPELNIGTLSDKDDPFCAPFFSNFLSHNPEFSSILPKESFDQAPLSAASNLSILCHDEHQASSHHGFSFPSANIPVSSIHLKSQTPRPEDLCQPQLSLSGDEAPTLLIGHEGSSLLLPASVAPLPNSPLPLFARTIRRLFSFRGGFSYSKDLHYKYSFPFPFRGNAHAIPTEETLLGAFIRIFTGGFSKGKLPAFPCAQEVPSPANLKHGEPSSYLTQRFLQEKGDYKASTLYNPSLYMGQNELQTKFIAKDLEGFDKLHFFPYKPPSEEEEPLFKP